MIGIAGATQAHSSMSSTLCRAFTVDVGQVGATGRQLNFSAKPRRPSNSTSDASLSGSSRTLRHRRDDHSRCLHFSRASNARRSKSQVQSWYLREELAALKHWNVRYATIGEISLIELPGENGQQSGVFSSTPGDRGSAATEAGREPPGPVRRPSDHLCSPYSASGIFGIDSSSGPVSR